MRRQTLANFWSTTTPYPVRPATGRHRATMYVSRARLIGGLRRSPPSHDVGNAHDRSGGHAPPRPIAALHFDRCPLTPPSTSAFAPTGLFCWTINR